MSCGSHLLRIRFPFLSRLTHHVVLEIVHVSRVGNTQKTPPAPRIVVWDEPLLLGKSFDRLPPRFPTCYLMHKIINTVQKRPSAQ